MPTFDREKFMARVDVRGDDECWPWKGMTTDDGYGRFTQYSHRYLAHRVSYELHSGPCPRTLCILHSCDNPACVNPKHLRLGTHQENMRERDEKGRQARGVRNGRAKLSVLSARACAALYEKGWTLQAIGDLFCVHPNTVRDIIKGNHWKKAA